MSIHESLIQTDDAELTIETTADVIKPTLAYGSKLVDELKLHVDSEGVHYDAVDPANVCYVGLYVPAEAFETFDVDETTIGVDLSKAMGALRAGRKKENDGVTLSYVDERLTTTVQRDYDETRLDLQKSFKTIDPDMLRQEPEIPELELPVEATVPRKLFEDVIEATDAVSNHIRIHSNGDDLLFSGNDDESESKAVVSDVVTGEGADSMFSLGYFKNLVKGLKTVDTDEITLKLGDEFPVQVEWETELNDVPVTGKWFQAPRVQSD